jgi:hypothetical protein
MLQVTYLMLQVTYLLLKKMFINHSTFTNPVLLQNKYLSFDSNLCSVLRFELQSSRL